MNLEMNVEYKDGWSATCEWLEGAHFYPHNRRLFLKASGDSPEDAVGNLVKKVDDLLAKTSDRIRSDFSKMEI